ncbi:MAG TPA: serine/threonine-protein kinase, partial [Isosphaeraceae bacterium]|nr:serine/threonine-protein kinase [Isosphaeraceae bacterium]
MSTGLSCDEDLLRRLPLPLAQLYRRAHNAKTFESRFNAAYCLWEASLKLLASVAVVEYAERGELTAELSERLKNLARPSLGHWWEISRSLVLHLAKAGDPGFRSVSDFLTGKAREDLPLAAGLDTVLRETLEGSAQARGTVRVSDLFDRLVHFRNREIGHGPLGQKSTGFYERTSGSLLVALSELLVRLDVLAGRRLVFVSDVRRQASGSWLVEQFDLSGEAPRRIEPLQWPAAQTATLPHPDRLYLASQDAAAPGPLLHSLHPLVLCNHETGEVFFLNARRGQKRTEYLCYHPGRVEERQDLGVEQRELLARVLGFSVDPDQVEKWSAEIAANEAPAEEKPALARRRIGEFELLSELGRGGMGVVYRAWQPSLSRQVALKCLLHVGDTKAAARFNREIRALGNVEHPHLVKAFTSGSDGDQWFYAMELVEGTTLASVCDTLQTRSSVASQVDISTWQESLGSACEKSRKAEKPLSDEALEGRAPTKPKSGVRLDSTSFAHGGKGYVRHMVELVRQVALAAHALHEAGVIHRDIKPGNIMVSAEGGQAVLMDLGLAQLADDLEGRLTRTRQFVGTLRYASPEQVLSSTKLDRRSDVYSLGATLWELLTLHPIYEATDATPTFELEKKILFQEPARLCKVNPAIDCDLEAIISRCLEKEPAGRYPTAALLAEDLR